MRPPFDRARTGGNSQVRFSADGQLLVWMYTVDEVNSANPELYEPLLPDSEVWCAASSVATARRLHGADPVRLAVRQPPRRRCGVGCARWQSPSVDGRHGFGAQSVRSRRATPTKPRPAVSPIDAIAYASDEVDFDLVLIPPDGRSRRTMLATARNELDPAWSPAGDQFAFVTDRSGTIEIWARSRDGLWERPIVTPSDFGDSRTDTLASLAFSPDGRTLAYQRGGDGTFEIWLSPATGGNAGSAHQLLRPISLRPYQDAPTWSPDGEWIAYHDQRRGEVRARQDSRLAPARSVQLLKDPIPSRDQRGRLTANGSRA